MREFSEKELEEKYKDLKMMDIPDMWEDIERNLAPKNAESTNAESKNAESTNAESKNAESTNAESKNAESTNAESKNAESTNAESKNAESTNVESTNAESQTTEKEVDSKKAVRSRRKRISIGRITSIAAVLAVVLLAVPVWNMIRQGVDGTIKSSDCAAGEGTEGFYESENTTESVEDSYIDESAVDESTENPYIDESTVDESAAANTEGASEEASVRNDTDGREFGTAQEALQSKQLTITVQILEVQETEVGLVIRTELLEDVEGHKVGEVLDISCDTGENVEFTGKMKLLVEETEEKLKLLQILP